MNNETKERYLFHFVSFLSLYHYHYFNLTHSIFIVSVENGGVREFVKQLSKVVTKFHGIIITTLSAWCILSNIGPTQFLIKMGV